MDRAAHWGRVWSTRTPGETSWHQDDPRTSLGLLDRAVPDAGSVLDVGGGASVLVDHLLRRGHDVTVLDIAAPALDAAKARLGADAERVRWLVADVTRADPADLGPVDAWHDRAVLHFLTDDADRAAYADLMRATVRVGGHAVLATFAPDGPERCSDLPVRRHDADDLVALAGAGWRLVDALREEHRTPWDAAQPFQYVLLRRVDA